MPAITVLLSTLQTEFLHSAEDQLHL